MFGLIALAGFVAGTMRMSVIPCYILVGMIAGPHVAGDFSIPGLAVQPHIPELPFINRAAELGLLFLLFFLGLKFRLGKLIDQYQKITRAGLLDLTVNFPVGLLVGYWLFGGWLEGFLLGGVVYISSRTITTNNLTDTDRSANAESGPLLNILLFEEMVIMVYMAVIAGLIRQPGGLIDFPWKPGPVMSFLPGLFLLVYLSLELFQRYRAGKSRQNTILPVVGLLVLLSGAGLASGVSQAVAVLFLGLAFSGTSYAEQLDQLISPIRDVFASVFFFWIGLITDPIQVLWVLGILGLIVLVTTLSKLASGYGAGLIYGLTPRRSMRTATGLVTRGEFSLVIAAVAASGSGVFLQQTLPTIAVGYVLLMSFVGSLLMISSDWLTGFLRLEPRSE